MSYMHFLRMAKLQTIQHGIVSVRVCFLFCAFFRSSKIFILPLYTSFSLKKNIIHRSLEFKETEFQKEALYRPKSMKSPIMIPPVAPISHPHVTIGVQFEVVNRSNYLVRLRQTKEKLMHKIVRPLFSEISVK